MLWFHSQFQCVHQVVYNDVGPHTDTASDTGNSNHAYLSKGMHRFVVLLLRLICDTI